ncbi:hypothetical protein Taro_018090 [Colocasia esculenta]|uniref:Uncharacterized protein n=1 Tax=Colocasia esculenta TaxID=4460 RepID=A0A843UPV1_COLES|nr:hypothetical protein [Colocasia esculenta]
MKTMAMRIISHLVQVPSTATQIKEILLSMPTIRRQLLQDIIRSSVSQAPKGSHMMSNNPSPVINLPVQLHVSAKQSPQQFASDSAHLHSHEDATKEETDGESKIDDDVDSDDDWDAFQYFPAAGIATAGPQSETDNSLVQSPVLGSEYQSSGSTLNMVSDEAKHEGGQDGVKDNAGTSIGNRMEDPLYSKPSTDDECVLEAEDGPSQLLDVSGPQPVDYAKDREI